MTIIGVIREMNLHFWWSPSSTWSEKRPFLARPVIKHVLREGKIPVEIKWGLISVFRETNKNFHWGLSPTYPRDERLSSMRHIYDIREKVNHQRVWEMNRHSHRGPSLMRSERGLFSLRSVIKHVLREGKSLSGFIDVTRDAAILNKIQRDERPFSIRSVIDVVRETNKNY